MWQFFVSDLGVSLLTEPSMGWILGNFDPNIQPVQMPARWFGMENAPNISDKVSSSDAPGHKFCKLDFLRPPF